MLTYTLNSKQLIWRFDGTPENQKLINFVCLDSNNCYAFHDGHEGWDDFQRVYYSKDKGRSWIEKFTIESYKEDWDIHTNNTDDLAAIDTNHFYFGMDTKSMLKYTNDGGRTINYLQFPDSNSIIQHVVMFDTLKGLVYTRDKFYRTFDGWDTFDTLQTNYSGLYYKKQIMNDSIIRWIYSNNIDAEFGVHGARYLIDYNINTNTDTIIYGFEEEYRVNDLKHSLSGLFFVNDSLGFICGYRRWNNTSYAGNDLIYKTTDGGSSWREVLNADNGSPFGLYEIAFANEKYGVTVGADGKLYETQDGGENWTYYPEPGEFVGLSAHVMFAGSTCIVGDLNGNLWTWEEPNGIVEEIIMEEEIKVIQTAEELKISIRDLQYRQYRIEIVDIMGRKVIDGSIKSNAVGNVFYSVDLQELNVGSYFFALSFEGVALHTGKFVK